MTPIVPLDRVIIVSISGRALAYSARKCAKEVIVLDAFADRDTQTIAQTFAVNVPGRVSLSRRRICAALSRSRVNWGQTTGQKTEDGRQKTEGIANQNRGLTPIVIGSGVEAGGSWLYKLNEHGQVLAQNSLLSTPVPIIVALEKLAKFGWSVPHTQLERPRDPRGWLQKRIGRSGGLHVKRAEKARPARDAYYQRHVDGTPMSVTFLAINQQARVLGFNQLLTEAVDDSPYCYAGAISGIELAPHVQQNVRERLQRMVIADDLRGLCGVDFVLSEGEAIALELNARPTASFELYDHCVPEGLVRWHVESFSNAPQTFSARATDDSKRSHGIQVVYSSTTITIPTDFTFPAWACDIPSVGAKIPSGAPFCSVRASGDDAKMVASELATRAYEMRRRLAAIDD